MRGTVITMSMMTKSYLEMIRLPTFEDRYEYLKIGGLVGEETFGYDRYLNQVLYRSQEWKRFRRDIILRDNGCDLGCDGYAIVGKILIHHINPITIEDVVNRNTCLFDPNNVISTSLNTHNAIHYGDAELLMTGPIERTKNDTCPWKQ